MEKKNSFCAIAFLFLCRHLNDGTSLKTYIEPQTKKLELSHFDKSMFCALEGKHVVYFKSIYCYKKLLKEGTYTHKPFHMVFTISKKRRRPKQNKDGTLAFYFSMNSHRKIYIGI